MNSAKRTVSILLCMAILIGSFVLPTAATEASITQALSALEGNTVVTWQKFYDKNTTNSGVTKTKVTNGTGLFAQYLQLVSIRTDNNEKNSQLQYKDAADGSKLGLAGAIQPGDNVLIHFIARSSNSAKVFMALWKNGNGGSTDNGTSAGYIPAGRLQLNSNWTEYYIPVTAGSAAPDSFVFFIADKAGAVDMAFMEIVNYGTTPLSQLPNKTVDLTDYTMDGRTVMYWHSLWNRYRSNNATGLVIDKITNGDGLFSHYLSLQTKTTDGNYKNRQFQYFDQGKGYGLENNLTAGENVVLHLIVRSGVAGTEAAFQPAIWRDGDTSTDPVTSVCFGNYTVNDHWTEYYIPAAGGTSAPNRFALFVGGAQQTLDVAMAEILAYGDTPIDGLPNSVTDLQADPNIGKVTDMYVKFSAAPEPTADSLYPTAKQLATNEVLNFGSESRWDEQKTLILTFDMKAKAVCTPVTITINGNATETYYVPVQWTRIEVPVKVSQLSSVKLTTDGNVLVGNAFYDYQGTNTLQSLQLRSGMHMLEDFTDVTINHNTASTVVGPTKDLVKVGDLIYSIGDSKLTITDVSNPSAPVVLGTLGKMGSDIRQICMLSDGKHVFISSRQNGCYIVNVEDPAAPKLVSTYDSVEMATGVDVYGDYVFVCDRQYGVEIVDVSDLVDPKQCAIVRGGTAQSCKVVNGILYMGSWNERSVDMYDVTQPSKFKYLGSAKLKGKGDGMAVLTVGEKTYLYAATGQHEAGVSENASSATEVETRLAQLKFGQGNGLDIFDVTDPANPVWLSTSRIDGRYYFPNNDYWEVEVAEVDGRIYAYYLNTYNGVYILDVTDPAAPIRIGHISVTSSKVGMQSFSGRASIFPYDQSIRRQSPIAAIACDDGVLYMASSLTDLHIYNGAELGAALHEADEKAADVPMEDDLGTFYDLDPDALGLKGFAHYQSVGQCYAVVAYDDRYYAACGAEGVVVLDKALNKLTTFDVEGVALDVQIQDGKLYCAAQAGGLMRYSLSADGLSVTEDWRYTSTRGVVRQVRLSPKGRWAIIMAGANRGEIISTETQQCVLNCAGNGQMYHHTILNTLAGGRYTGIWNENGKTYWYDFGENDDLSVPVLVSEWASNVSAINNGSMTAGVPGYPGCVLATRNIADGAAGGYSIYDPTATNASILTGKDADTPFSGKPVIYENLLITGERINGRIVIVDISDLKKPNVVKTIPVNGNPDIPIVDEGAVLVPLGYQGLVKFELGELDPRQKQAALTISADTDVTLDEITQTVAVSGGSGTGKLSFTVSDGSVATVDGTGKLTYLKPGSFTVTVTKEGDATYQMATATSAVITVRPTDLSAAQIMLTPDAFPYDGTEKKPAVTVRLGDKTLAEGADYTVAYANNTAVGTATVTVTGMGNYTGTASKTFTIKAAGIEGAEITLSQTEYIYDGTEKKPTVTVGLQRKALVEGADYQVSYTNNRNAGIATVTVTFCGSYTGSASATFTIVPKALTVTATVADKAWDGTSDATLTSATAEGIVAGDEVTLTPGIAKFATAEPGNDIAVTFFGFGLDGKDAANYTLNQPAATTANITVAKAVADVEAAIAALPNTNTLTEEQKEQVKAVKTAFDALSEPLQQQLTKSAIEKLQKLVKLAEQKPSVTPPTGDSIPLAAMMTVLILSAAGLALLYKRRYI